MPRDPNPRGDPRIDAGGIAPSARAKKVEAQFLADAATEHPELEGVDPAEQARCDHMTPEHRVDYYVNPSLLTRIKKLFRRDQYGL